MTQFIRRVAPHPVVEPALELTEPTDIGEAGLVVEERQGGRAMQRAAFIAHDLGHGAGVERARRAQRLAQHAHRLTRREPERAADRLTEYLRIGFRSFGVALIEHALKQMGELGRARQRQRHAARVALDLHGQMEHRADQHDALLARAERWEQVAQPAQRDRIVEPAVRVEHRE